MLLDDGTAFLRSILGDFLLRLVRALHSEDLFHLDKELVVLISDLLPRGGVDPDSFVVAGELSSLESIGLIGQWPLMGYDCPNREEEPDHLGEEGVTVRTWLAESKPLKDSWMERGISSSLFLVIQGCLRASLTL